jgi:small GTP-binding protein
MLIELTSKIVLVGDVAVGKTSIAKKYIYNEHTIKHLMTIGVDYFVKNNIINKDKNQYNIRLQLWDTAGMEKFRSITKMYYMGASYIIIAFDMSNMDSFLNATTNWEQIIHNTIQYSIIIYVGNKYDIANKKVLDAVNIWLSQNKHIIFFKTSLNDIETINNIFNYISNDIINHYNNNTLPYGTTSSTHISTNIHKKNIEQDDKISSSCWC